MENKTPEQVTQLSTWASERDTILSEISILKDEKEKIIKQRNEAAESATEIENKVQQFIGRMAELDKQEKQYEEIVSVEIPKLETHKTRLETQITALASLLDGLEITKSKLQTDIEFLTKVQSEIFNRTEILEKVVEHVTNVSSANIKELNNAVIEITTKVKDILALSDSELKAHTEILNEIPRLFVELQKKILIRQKI
jgi:chromosome segregation ATPase